MLTFFKITNGATSSRDAQSRSTPDTRLATPSKTPIIALEALLILLLFVLLAGQAAPGVNESHYLTKAKHFWNPDWCANDLFLSSADSHWMFYCLFGWLTKFVSLEVFAWLGRIGTWLAIAWAWQRLSWRLIPIPFFAPLTAVLFFLLNDRFHLAGEWVIGGFEAKGIAYCFVILGLSELAVNHWNRVWPFLGLAAVFHVLVGAWAIVAAWMAWVLWLHRTWQHHSNRPLTGYDLMMRYRRELQQQLPWLGLGLLLIVVGAIPPLLADQNTTNEIKRHAAEIYVNERIAHHLTFGAFPVWHVARFVAMVGGWFLLHRGCRALWASWADQFGRMYLFGLASLLISFAGLMLSGLADSDPRWQAAASRWLRFYWFRLSDFAIPATGALMVGWIVSHWLRQSRELARRWAAGFAVVMLVAAVLALAVEKRRDSRPVADQRSLPNYPDDERRTMATYEKWRQVCQWIKQNTPAEAVFITPVQQQTFKWYAERAEAVNWKDIPQDSESIIQWNQRVTDLLLPQKQYEAGIMSYSDEQLRDLAKKYNADYLVVLQWQVELVNETELKQVYPVDRSTKSAYVVLELNR